MGGYCVATAVNRIDLMQNKGLVWALAVIAVSAVAVYGLQATGYAPALIGGTSTAPAQQTTATPPKRPPAPVETAVAERKTLRDGIAVIGSLLANESANISADSNGRVVAVLAIDGTQVKKGDELFRLDGALIDVEIRDAEARLSLAQNAFRRSQTLARSKITPQSEVDQSRADFELAATALELARERQRRLIIRAPFDGTLGFRVVSEGAYVTAGTPMVQLDQITRLKVGLSIPERFFMSLAIGQSVDLSADALPGQKFQAKISAINPVVDVNGRALQVQAVLENNELKLRPGMLVRAEVLGPERQAVTVLESAIVAQGQDSLIFEVQDETAKRRKVVIGQRRDGWVEILSGLDAGATVVSAGATRLADGAPVKVTKPAVSQ
jgi:membrane fusion protein, multidrug efflux system